MSTDFRGSTRIRIAPKALSTFPSICPADRTDCLRRLARSMIVEIRENPRNPCLEHDARKRDHAPDPDTTPALRFGAGSDAARASEHDDTKRSPWESGTVAEARRDHHPCVLWMTRMRILHMMTPLGWVRSSAAISPSLGRKRGCRAVRSDSSGWQWQDPWVLPFLLPYRPPDLAPAK